MRAICLQASGVGIRKIQESLGYMDVQNTVVDFHVTSWSEIRAGTPLDTTGVRERRGGGVSVSAGGWRGRVRFSAVITRGSLGQPRQSNGHRGQLGPAVGKLVPRSLRSDTVSGKMGGTLGLAWRCGVV